MEKTNGNTSHFPVLNQLHLNYHISEFISSTQGSCLWFHRRDIN